MVATNATVASNAAAPAAAAAATAHSQHLVATLKALRCTLTLLLLLNVCMDSGRGRTQAQQLSPLVRQKYCGKALAEAFDLVCVHGYNDKLHAEALAMISAGTRPHKRKANDFDFELATAAYALDDDDDDNDNGEGNLSQRSASPASPQAPHSPPAGAGAAGAALALAQAAPAGQELQSFAYLWRPPPLAAAAAAAAQGTEYTYALSPLLSRIYGANVLVQTVRRLRRQGGVYDECCRKSCTYNELAAYCRNV